MEAGKYSLPYNHQTSEPQAVGSTYPPTHLPANRLTCIRCGFPVPLRMSGCKNPCYNCGTIYPLGDCSD